jgi:uncharacterized protein (DUF362 family)
MPAIVGLAHATEDPEDPTIVALCEEALAPLGGIRAFVRPGDSVVLKPNQTIWFLGRDGITTDPRVVAAMVKLSRDAGAREIIVGDSSGGDTKTMKIMEATGIARYAREAGADRVVAFEDEPQTPLRVRARGETYEVPVPSLLLDADTIIGMPKAKTHFYDPISCALKNWVGIPHQKERPHLMVDGVLQEAVVELHRQIPAKLHVVDGLWAGEGTGPVTNDPVWLGCIVAGADPVAVDVTVARLLRLNVAELQFVRAAKEAGLGEADPSRITVRGGDVDALAIHVQPAKRGFDHLPVRVLVGEGVTWAGSLGHFKSIAESFLKYRLWDIIIATYGKPTFMIGAVEDPDLESHVAEGPYFAIDDAVLEQYRSDSRIVFIGGHPATHNIFPYIFRRLAVPRVGPAALQLKRVMEEGASWFHYRGWAPDERLDDEGPPTSKAPRATGR